MWARCDQTPTERRGGHVQLLVAYVDQLYPTYRGPVVGVSTPPLEVAGASLAGARPKSVKSVVGASTATGRQLGTVYAPCRDTRGLAARATEPASQIWAKQTVTAGSSDIGIGSREKYLLDFLHGLYVLKHRKAEWECKVWLRYAQYTSMQRSVVRQQSKVGD